MRFAGLIVGAGYSRESFKSMAESNDMMVVMERLGSGWELGLELIE